MSGIQQSLSASNPLITSAAPPGSIPFSFDYVLIGGGGGGGARGGGGGGGGGVLAGSFTVDNPGPVSFTIAGGGGGASGAAGSDAGASVIVSPVIPRLYPLLQEVAVVVVVLEVRLHH